jgi:hypothetical protein
MSATSCGMRTDVPPGASADPTVLPGMAKL